MAAPTLKGKTLFITGASRGIGLAIGLRAARDGANVAIAAKTAGANAKLPGTIYTAAKEIEAAGGIARREATRTAEGRALLDCFAALAMTGRARVSLAAPTDGDRRHPQ
jgi:NAD(P)-dependent dehydrogenase (short-subunit alcohol dehydrogenase family)